MKKLSVHSVFIGVLAVSFCLAAVLPWLAGGGYYALGIAERPFHPQFHSLKPSGRTGHLYGIVGSGMILAGVVIYSARKRFRIFTPVGKMNFFLAFHIALCLVGPTLIAYHATFKMGGLAGAGFWSMAAVVASGFIGRYLWVQIPKGIEGNDLSILELEKENSRLFALLKEHHNFSSDQIATLDRMIDAAMPARDSSFRTLQAVVRHDVRLFSGRRALAAWLSANGVSPRHVSACVKIASRRSRLHRRVLFFKQLHRVFQYWHVVHLPFAAVLLIIFLVHVATAFLFGYMWGS